MAERIERDADVDPCRAPSNTMALANRTIVLILMLCALGFAAMAYSVESGGALMAWDAHVEQWIARLQNADLTTVMAEFSHLHNTVGILTMTVLLTWYFHRRGAWLWTRMALLGIPGGMMLNFGLKHVFQRPRPSVEMLDNWASTLSFPSGHAMAATLVYGVAIVGLLSEGGPRWRMLASTALGVGLCMGVGFSRLYLHVHYLSDVVAAWLEGTAWLCLVFLMLRSASQRRRDPGMDTAGPHTGIEVEKA